MKNSKIIKILLTIVILVVAGLVLLMSVAIAGSSHNISSESRDNATTNGFLAIGLGLVLIILLWIPWGQVTNRSN